MPVKWPVISPRLRCDKMLMIEEKIKNNIFTLLLLSSFLFAQDSLSNSSNNVEQNVPVVKSGSGFVQTTNRLPQLLKDVKILLTDAIIADAQGDTLEVSIIWIAFMNYYQKRINWAKRLLKIKKNLTALKMHYWRW